MTVIKLRIATDSLSRQTKHHGGYVMQKISLNGIWNMSGGGYACSGTIPGSVCSFLLDAGLMEDPYYRENELQTLALLENPFTFSRTFSFHPDGSKVLLRCEGLDTICTISINGKEVASTWNMHRTFEFDVTDRLLDGENTITVHFDPAAPYVREMDQIRHLHSPPDAIDGFTYLRKAHCMFGWDWGPRIPDAGIWRNICLIIMDTPRITDCKVSQHHENGHAYLRVDVETSASCCLEAVLSAPNGTQSAVLCGEEFEVLDPQLWWPNGLGDQPLYHICISAKQEGVVVDTVTKTVGLRTLKLVREKDRYGESFYHEVNGVAFFAMGADYIPEDCILSRVTPERTRWLLQQCKDSHFNAIRVWGGGHYPDDAFFDLCDEFGLVVFLDLMVACGYLPDCENMRQDITAEVRDNLLRIRHHACIGVLCGNNEVEQFVFETPMEPDIEANYLTLFEDVFPNLVKELCPALPYIPSSPTTCGHFVDPHNENYGDNHYWKVWHENEPYYAYRKHFFRYLSEFGFQSFPCEKTVNSFTLPEDRNVFSRIMERHQRNGNANGKILSYLSQTFLYPHDFGTLLYASQLLQATAIQYGVEHLRRNRGRCMGTLYWQLNDIWPVASWASIDYYGRYKALQYVARRFYAPVMISCDEVGETTTRANVNMQAHLHDYATTAALAVSNESRQEVKGVIHWALCDASSNVLCSGSQDVTVPALSSITFDRMDFHKTDVENNHLFYWLDVDGQTVSQGSVLFTAPKHYRFRNPQLSWELNGDTITVHASAYAKFVEIDSPDSDFILSDNYFDMEKGSYTVKILSGSPKTIRLRSVYDIR